MHWNELFLSYIQYCKSLILINVYHDMVGEHLTAEQRTFMALSKHDKTFYRQFTQLDVVRLIDLNTFGKLRKNVR